MPKRTLPLLAATLLFVCAAIGCSPAPSRVLTPDEKRADMLWMYSMFDQNYAPREYKAKTLGFDYQQLKADYLQRALQTTDNESFYYLMNNFVAEFHDAHTGATLMTSSLPGRTQIAYLGFEGVRQGGAL